MQRLILDFNICYDEIDGNSLYHTFGLMVLTVLNIMHSNVRKVFPRQGTGGMVMADSNHKDKVNLTEISNELYKSGQWNEGICGKTEKIKCQILCLRTADIFRKLLIHYSFQNIPNILSRDLA